MALFLVPVGGLVFALGLVWAIAKIGQYLEERKYRAKKREPKMTMSRSTATTVRLDLDRDPTLEELEKFVEEARLGGVSPKATVDVHSSYGYGYNRVSFAVRQKLDLE